MRSSIVVAAIAAGIVSVTAIGVATAFVPGIGAERVRLPEALDTAFLLYDKVDRPDRARVRFMYIDRVSAAAARPGEPLPNGTVIVMEDHGVERDAAGTPLRDAAGRLRPTAEILGREVMEKRAGYGAAIPEAYRNGDWDYASYLPNGQVNARAQANLYVCFDCHKPRAGADYTFTTFAAVQRGLGR